MIKTLIRFELMFENHTDWFYSDCINLEGHVPAVIYNIQVNIPHCRVRAVPCTIEMAPGEENRKVSLYPGKVTSYTTY